MWRVELSKHFKCITIGTEIHASLGLTVYQRKPWECQKDWEMLDLMQISSKNFFFFFYTSGQQPIVVRFVLKLISLTAYFYFGHLETKLKLPHSSCNCMLRAGECTLTSLISAQSVKRPVFWSHDLFKEQNKLKTKRHKSCVRSGEVMMPKS